MKGFFNLRPCESLPRRAVFLLPSVEATCVVLLFKSSPAFRSRWFSEESLSDLLGSYLIDLTARSSLVLIAFTFGCFASLIFRLFKCEDDVGPGSPSTTLFVFRDEVSVTVSFTRSSLAHPFITGPPCTTLPWDSRFRIRRFPELSFLTHTQSSPPGADSPFTTVFLDGRQMPL